jgi:predicted phosphodiesterase
MVMGNMDAGLLKAANSGGKPPDTDQRRVLNENSQWLLAQLSEADLAFMANFRPTVEIPLGNNQNLLCFHGSPASFEDEILPTTPNAEVHRLLAPYLPHIMCGGHAHIQQLRRINDTFFFNPGSVGYAYNQDQSRIVFLANPWAEYAILTIDDGRLSLDYRRIPFDVPALITAYQDSGKPNAAEDAAQYRTAP